MSQTDWHRLSGVIAPRLHTLAPSTRPLRNTAAVIKHAESHCWQPRDDGSMDVYGRSGNGRTIRLARGDHAGQDIVDFVRRSYPRLDNHPHVIAPPVFLLKEHH
ncbi:hypothetical protein [Microvirga zambiensis]|uniref:hypothetical protein n=1 Tax=Microvirga zambiensis TaxID=1402137 RepID=UPI00191DD24C|nr:hypothetical protein [Microvirga zambiensis]